MPTAGKPKIKNYGLDFKLRAVQLSHQPGVLVKDVADSRGSHPLVTASQPPATVHRWRTASPRPASHKPMSMLSLWTSNPATRVVDLPMARLLDKHAAATADRLVARHTSGAQSTVDLEASLLKLSNHLV